MSTHVRSVQSHFGADWKSHLPAKFKMTLIKELIDHVIDEGNHIFADTRYANS